MSRDTLLVECYLSKRNSAWGNRIRRGTLWMANGTVLSLLDHPPPPISPICRLSLFQPSAIVPSAFRQRTRYEDLFITCCFNRVFLTSWNQIHGKLYCLCP